MAFLRRLLFLLVLPIAAYGQGIRYDNFVLKPTVTGGVTPVSGALITVCTSAGTGTPCTPKVANIYSNEALSSAITGTGGAGTTNSDANGNFGFYITPGDYVITVTGSGITSYTINVTLPCGLTTACLYTGKSSFANIANSILFVDDKTTGALYPTCQSAVTAAGSRPTIIMEAGDYSGADCTLPVPNNIVLYNMNGTTEYTNGMNLLYTSGGGTQSYMHAKMQRSTIPASGAIVTGYFTTTLNNYTQVSGVGADGSSSEMFTTGTMSGTLPVLQGAENNVNFGTTGGTVTNATGTVGYVNSSAGSTTAITTVMGVRGLGSNNMAGSVPVNTYGLFGEDQTAGTTRNYALGAKGWTLLLYSSNKGAAGIDVEDTALATHHMLYLDSTNLLNLQAAAVQGIAFNDSAGSTRMTFTNAGLKVATGFTPTTAAGIGLGTNALPFSNLVIGTAATNNLTFTPAATAAARTVNLPDPLGTVSLPYVIASGTTTLTANAALAAVTSQAANTTAATGTLTTDSIEWAFASAPTAGDNLCHVLPYVTAGNVNFVRTNPTAAAQNVSALVINWRVIR